MSDNTVYPPLDNLSAKLLAGDIMRTHPMVIIGGTLQQNPFYVPPDEMLTELKAREGASAAGAD